jgi:hypothetical protein
MTISEQKRIIGIPVETTPLTPGDTAIVRANDFYRECAGGAEFQAGMSVDSEDDITLYSVTDAINSVTYHKEEINKLAIVREELKRLSPVQKRIVWERD